MAFEDRAQLLALIARMRPYLQHSRRHPACDSYQREYIEIPGSGGMEEGRDRACNCDLDALLRDLGES